MPSTNPPSIGRTRWRPPRFTVQRTPDGVRVQLQEGDGDPGTGLTIDRALALLEKLLEQGRAVTIRD